MVNVWASPLALDLPRLKEEALSHRGLDNSRDYVLRVTTKGDSTLARSHAR